MIPEQQQTIVADDQPDPDSRLPFLDICRSSFLIQLQKGRVQHQVMGLYPKTKKDDMYSRQNQLNRQRSMWHLMQSRSDNAAGWRDTTATVC